jgi:DNA-binding transcriptional MerR regulator
MAIKSDEQFTLTTGAVAREVDPPCDTGTVREYANAGLIECFRLSNGVRLFKPSAAAEVMRIRAERLARRGGDTTKRAPAAA